MKRKNMILIVTASFLAIMTGLFFSFSVAVMPGLKDLSDRVFIESMKSINQKIQNPVFFVVFFGVIIGFIASLYINFSRPLSVCFYFVLIAALIYFIAVFVVTIAGNIPLNNAIDRFDLAVASEESLKQMRSSFELKWTMFNNIRTIASVFSFVIFLLACIRFDFK